MNTNEPTPTPAAMQATLVTLERPALADAAARRATLTAIISRLEAQKALADQMAELARDWRTQAGRAMRQASITKDAEGKARAWDELGVAVDAASEAAGLAFRLTARIEHLRAELDRLGGR